MSPSDCPFPVCGDKLAALESQVTQLRINEATRIAAIDHLTQVAETLTQRVEQLTLVLERGRGAAWAVRALWAAVIGAAAWIASHLAERSG